MVWANSPLWVGMTRIGSELKESFPSSELYLIPKSGHLPNLEQKKKFNKVLKDFLQK